MYISLSPGVALVESAQELAHASYDFRTSVLSLLPDMKLKPEAVMTLADRETHYSNIVLAFPCVVRFHSIGAHIGETICSAEEYLSTLQKERKQLIQFFNNGRDPALGGVPWNM